MQAFFISVMQTCEVLESVLCDVIKIRLKRRDATRNKVKQNLHLKFGNPSFKIDRSISVLIFSGWFPFPLLVTILLFRRIFMTSHMTLSSASKLAIISCLFGSYNTNM